MGLYESSITMLESAIHNMEDAQAKCDECQPDGRENVPPKNLIDRKPDFKGLGS